MSKFNKCGLAAAVLAAMALPMAANAATAGYPRDTNITFASNLFGDKTATITNPAPFTISTQAADNIIGRTTGFGVRLVLGNGAEFATGTTAPAIVTGGALVGYATPHIENAAKGNTMVVSVTPDTDATTITNIGIGEMLVFPAGSIVLDTVTALATPGASIPVTIELFDSNSAQVILRVPGTVPLATSVEGTTVTFAPQQGDPYKKIDVSPCNGGVPKTLFSPSGYIGESCTYSESYTTVFDAGAISLGITQGASGPVLATGFTGANSNGTSFVYAPADEFDLTVTGANFGAFAEDVGSVFLSNDGCSAPAYATGTVSGDRATFEGVALSDIAGYGPAGATVHVCFSVDGKTQIAAQALSASVAIDFNDDQVVPPDARSGSLLPLMYNGTVLEFQNFNPASNPRAESFIRLTNNNSTSCPVTLTGKDDSGMPGASGVALTLAPQTSVTLTSGDVENGSAKATGAFGDGAGRWYLTVDAECGNFVGSALNRNLEDGTVTNLTTDKRSNDSGYVY